MAMEAIGEVCADGFARGVGRGYKRLAVQAVLIGGHNLLREVCMADATMFAFVTLTSVRSEMIDEGKGDMLALLGIREQWGAVYRKARAKITEMREVEEVAALLGIDPAQIQVINV